MRGLILVFVLFASSAYGLEVMFYNVENLFDTTHDKGKNDWEFVPLKTKGKKEACKTIKRSHWRDRCFATDWTQDRLEVKLGQIKRVLTGDGKNAPDIIALSEVENQNVAAMLVKKMGGYKFVISNSPDRRGIDLAILYKDNKELKLIAKKDHVLRGEYFAKKPSRNILEARFKYKGHKLAVFANHWPAPFNPTEGRMLAASHLRKKIGDLLKEDKSYHVVALGDFNVINDEHPNPIKGVIERDGFLLDTKNIYRRSRLISKKKKSELPLGTYFYPPQMSWDSLDRIFVSKKLGDKKGLDFDVKSFRIHNIDFLTTDYVYTKGSLKGSVVRGTPKRYDHRAKLAKNAGYSDHFPVSVQLKVY